MVFGTYALNRKFRTYSTDVGTFDTRAEAAYARMRADILTGRLLPGQRLLTAELTARYGASVGALREGLSRLAEQGLVTSEPRHGFRVKPVDREDLIHLTDARKAIESLVFRRSLEAGDLAWESRLVAAHHVLDGTPQLSDEDPRRVNEAWAAAHSTFHSVLLEACPNGRLRDIASGLRDAAELYRRWSRHLGREGATSPGNIRRFSRPRFGVTPKPGPRFSCATSTGRH
jgi:DNA-binding GntR family transcriptional regulator